MDTPKTNPSISPFEDEPVFIFMNGLSPIKPMKSAQISQTFSSGSFPSPPRVFTSPHLNCFKEPRFLRSHNPLATSRPEVSSEDLNKFQTNEGTIADSIHSYHNSSESQENALVGIPVADDSVPLPGQHTEFSAEIPQALKYNNYGNPGYDPGHETNPLLGLHGEAKANFAYVQESFRIDPNERELLNQGFSLFDSKSQESEFKGWRRWDNSVSGDTDLFFTNNATLKGLMQNPPVDRSMPLISQYGLKDNRPVEQKPYAEFVTRRRYLNFKKSNLPRKNSDDHLKLGSVIHSDEKSLANEKQLVPAKSNSSSPKCILPGSGLDLEAFEGLKLDKKVINNDKLSCGIPVSLPSCTSSLQFFRSHEHQGALAMELDSSVFGSQLAEDCSPASDSTIGEDFNQNSPRKKRQARLRKFDAAETGGCKGCKCKKSKCLKLYCECFARGEYCKDDCSCQNCYNKHIHQDIILQTRKQIESRNPLAFAPKIVTSSPEIGIDPNKTPASARHKRGCNCKKSVCLKKYCECFQAGVGCSESCRCEGCKNTFGRKDGSNSMGVEAEPEEETEEREKADAGQKLGKPNTLLSQQPKHFQAVLEEEMPDAVGLRASDRSPTTCIKTSSPNGKRISSPSCDLIPSSRGGRKLILQSIPSFPFLTDHDNP
ncbi:hypothetical protein PIB30_023081 [Stylosanthes scabra]|uniref:CRC domain-containing protein n=1 Tax=Stylosanthes scabra TaxID=79078 RepID=A0ABU6X9D6_9FABA|nr:hypothetical protein [Stylosanthes scabra]